ncbi:hypothetical protein MK280_10200, partial [Myxococcota bacterium]|nr:hypothetical protein [Myxococcota bacterium]
PSRNFSWDEREKHPTTQQAAEEDRAAFFHAKWPLLPVFERKPYRGEKAMASRWSGSVAGWLVVQPLLRGGLGEVESFGINRDPGI